MMLLFLHEMYVLVELLVYIIKFRVDVDYKIHVAWYNFDFFTPLDRIFLYKEMYIASFV